MDNKYIDLNQVCRICLLNESNLLNICEENININDNIIELIDALNGLSEFKIIRDDMFTLICTICVDKVINAINFKMQYETSYNFILDYLKSMELEEVENKNVEHITIINELEPKVELVEIDEKPPKKQVIRKKVLKRKVKYIKHESSEESDFDEPNEGLTSAESYENLNNDLKEDEILIIVSKDNEDKPKTIKSKPKKLNKKKLVDTENEEDFDNNTDELDNIVSCFECNKSFKNKYVLKAHMLRHQNKGQFVCTSCGKGFNSRACLTRHTKIHTGEKEYECEVCNRKFMSSNNLKLHSRTHTGIKPYLCTICGKSFGHPTGLTYHMRTHTNERPHTCEYCGKKFIIQCHYDRHKKTHTGERPFICAQCGKAFIKKFDLQRHEAIHSGKKPHSCHICEKSFLRIRHLKMHIMVHTDERPHVCSACGKRFIRKFYLNDHQKKHHQEYFFDQELDVKDEEIAQK